MNKICILLVSFLFLQGCDWGLGAHYDPTSETLHVDYYKEPCSNTSTDMCFRMRFDTAAAFVLSTVPNTGFDHLELGKRYTVQVEVEYDSKGKDSLYRLLAVSSEEIVDAATNSFTLAISMSSQILLDNLNNSWILAGEDVFSCNEADCISLTNAYNSGERVQLKFSASNDQLTLLEFVCSAAGNDFASTCEGINKVNWDIAHYQSDCGLYDPKLCFIYRDNANSDEPWHILPLEITDFSAVWGTEYDIQVEVASSAGFIRSAHFLEENSQEDLSSVAFNVVMRTGVKGLKKSNGGLISYDGIEFNCELNEQCGIINNAIDNASSSSERILALLTQVKIVDEQSILIIQSLTCDEESIDFKTMCADLNDDVIWQ